MRKTYFAEAYYFFICFCQIGQRNPFQQHRSRNVCSKIQPSLAGVAIHELINNLTACDFFFSHAFAICQEELGDQGLLVAAKHVKFLGKPKSCL